MFAPPFVRPDVRRFLDYLNTAPGPKAHEVDVATARLMTRALRDLADTPRGEIALVRDLAMPGPGGPLPLRLYDARPDRAPGPVVVFFHGGGFVLGDLESHDAACASIARGLDLPLVAVDYRLAPEHPWPAAPDDAEAAARWIAAGNLMPATALVLAGDSAGGNLAIVTALALRDRPADVPVAAQWLLYPATDLVTVHPSYEAMADGYFLTREGMDWFGRAYAADNRDWRASPAVADQAGLPPSVVVTAGLDPLRDAGRAYAASLVMAGVPTLFREAAGTVHGFMTLRRAIPSAEGDLQDALAALGALIAPRPAGDRP